MWPECGVGNGSGFSDVIKKLFWSTAAARWERGRARETGARGRCCPLLQRPRFAGSGPSASRPASRANSRSGPAAAAGQPTNWPAKQPVRARSSLTASSPTPSVSARPSAPAAALSFPQQPASPLWERPVRRQALSSSNLLELGCRARFSSYGKCPGFLPPAFCASRGHAEGSKLQFMQIFLALGACTCSAPLCEGRAFHSSRFQGTNLSASLGLGISRT